MHAHTLKLDCAQVAVKVGPGSRRGTVEPVNATIISVEKPPRSIEAGGMMVHVGTTGWSRIDVGPADAKVRRSNDTVRPRSSARIDDGCIRRVNNQRGVIPTLATHVIRCGGGKVHERHAAVI